jgi:hypothetical protein
MAPACLVCGCVRFLCVVSALYGGVVVCPVLANCPSLQRAVLQGSSAGSGQQATGQHTIPCSRAADSKAGESQGRKSAALRGACVELCCDSGQLSGQRAVLQGSSAGRGSATVPQCHSGCSRAGNRTGYPGTASAGSGQLRAGQEFRTAQRGILWPLNENAPLQASCSGAGSQGRKSTISGLHL